MSLINSTAIPNGAKAYELEQSLRFNDDNESYLSFTPSSTGNRKVWTWSCWVKRGNLSLGNQSTLFHSYGSGDQRTELVFESNNTLRFAQGTAGDDGIVTTTAVFRDTSSWYHIMVVADFSNGTAGNRFKLYVNGLLAANTINAAFTDANGQMPVANVPIEIGGRTDNRFFDGYLAEVNFIDGTAKVPADFGETGAYGEWKPIEYSGSYGTNGFYLPYKQDYTVEGFSTVTWKGNNINGNYIGGVGFNPDMTWIARTSAADNRVLIDSVRGVTKRLLPNATDAEATEANILRTFETDGFTLGSDNYSNYSAANYVAWNWDMGSPSPKQITANGNAKISTTQEKFGSSSAYFDGTGDYLSIPQNSDFNLSTTTDFTVECWVYHTDTIGGDRVYVSQTEGTYANSWYLRAVSGGEVNATAWIGGSNYISVQTSSGVVTQNNWHHVALVKTGTNYKIFIDGTDRTSSGGTDSDSAILYTGELRIGDNGSGQYMVGYIDEIRISHTARYSSNFTPTTSAFTRDSNTKLLMHNEGTNNSTVFLDHSGMDVNTSGSITSNVKANPSYGQSIVSWTGDNGGATIGHGLSSAPQMIILKERGVNDYWYTYHVSVGNTKTLNLAGTEVETSANFWGNTTPTANVFTVGSSTNTNNSTGIVAYCWHSVTGYSKFGTYNGTGSTHAVALGFAPAFIMIKCTNVTHPWVILDNTRQAGTALKYEMYANTQAGEGTDASGVLFTSTGFQLTTDNSYVNQNTKTFIYMAFADKREYAYWLDQSGNNNDWTSNNLTESDIMVDSPTNNFSTIDRAASGAGVFAEGNLKYTSTADTGVGTLGISSGKAYFEVTISSTSNSHIGVCDIGKGISPTRGGNWANHGGITYKQNGDQYALPQGGGSSSTVSYNGSSYTNGDIIGVAINVDDDIITFYKNGSSQGNAAEGPSHLSTNGVYSLMVYGGGTVFVANFGQDSSFAGTKTAQGNQDGNDIGDFYYTPPTGFLALCTKNLPNVAVVPSEHFNTITYSGNSTNRTLTGVGFSPSFTWIKSRGNATNGSDHFLFDAVRGVNAFKGLCSNGTSVEGETAAGSAQENFGDISAFTSDGYSVYRSTADSSHQYEGVNNNSETYVAWNWKANGSGSSNTNGSINSTVSANVDAGFSVVSYTGNGTASATVGHGLSAKPEMIIIKSRTGSAKSWYVYHEGLHASSPEDYRVELNTTAAASSNTTGNSLQGTAPTNSLFTLGNGSWVNENTKTLIAYCFHSVDGYSKVGSYTGNGVANNGTFVYTGFRPKFVLIKRSNSDGQAAPIFDSARSPFNIANKGLKSNSSNAEITTDGGVDILSNGFKANQNDGEVNSDGGIYIYLAFAETPFKYSNAR